MWPLLFLIQTAVALDPVQTAIEHAQGLALKKNRQEATASLREAIVQQPKAKAKLIEALQQISKVFFTDKGQKAFEAGQSLMFDNPDMALQQLKEALAQEDGNLAVLATIAKVQLAKQDCGGAEATLEKARRMNPFASEPAVLEMRTLVCQKNFEALRERTRLLPTLDKWEEQFVQYLNAQAGPPRKAYDVLLRVTEERADFPEAYLQLARAEQALAREDEPALTKYISLCKAVTTKERRRFSLEPRLCQSLKEAEDELAKKSADL